MHVVCMEGRAIVYVDKAEKISSIVDVIQAWLRLRPPGNIYNIVIKMNRHIKMYSTGYVTIVFMRQIGVEE